MKRIQPRAMGRAFHIRHRTSHITITLTQPPEGRAAAVRGRERRAEPGPAAKAARPGKAGPPARSTRSA
jgi:hypothetical protein